jgi:hypothetical protein
MFYIIIDSTSNTTGYRIDLLFKKIVIWASAKT